MKCDTLEAKFSDYFLSKICPASMRTESERPQGSKTSRGSHAGQFLFIGRHTPLKIKSCPSNLQYEVFSRLIGKITLKALIIAIIAYFGLFLSSCTPAYSETASWYSEKDPGVLKTTANMEVFDDDKLTCASWDYPFNTRLRVVNVRNGRGTIVRVNDRGPAKRLYKRGRVLDLSKRAFSQIADIKQGIVEIEIEVLK